jgi:diacylglycerol diphosphate phosphatase/phosphatidate phosphatase
MFSLNNLNIQYPHALVERVSVGWNIFYAGAVPLISLLLVLGVLNAGVHKFQVTILGLFVSYVNSPRCPKALTHYCRTRIALTIFITDIVKNAVGRTRPDLIARCKPAPGTPTDKLVTIDVCTETDHHILNDGWRSFPSGHSSFAFSGLGFLALFFAGQLQVFLPRTDLGRALIALAPLLGAAMIAISRCEDYRHDVYDVTFGSILGMTIAYFSYRRYYPRLHSAKCDEPFPSREKSFNEGFGKLKNDEEAVIRGAREFEMDASDDGS